ncbi:MAG: alpha-amylase, partial [Treponema sp.]|nr:alpha-amylase [Treponema sp.]
MQEILHVAHNFPIIRFDAAMVLAKKSIRRLWYPEPGHGGDIATRSETGLSTQQFNDAIPNEFWREVVDRVAQECPDTLLLAEAFWMMEGYFVRTLGMHRVYNSAFMNMLKKEENQKYRDTIKNTITFDPQVLKRYVNFMNNPDEETAIAQFGDGDKYFGVCTLMITMPGLPMFGHGQIEGFTEKYGMEYTKAYKDEKPSQYLVDRHWHDIFPLMKKRYLFSGVDNFLLYDLWEDGHVNENVFCYSNGAGNERAIVFYNNKYDQAHGWIKQSDPYAVKTGNGDEIVMKTRSVSEGLNLTAEDDKYCIFQEHKSRLWFVRKSSEICEKGMFVMLNGFEYQVYLNVHQVSDEADHRYKILCEYLNGRGCEDIETAWQEIIYKDLYAALHDYASKLMGRVFAEFGYEKIKPAETIAEDAVQAKASKKAAKKPAEKKPLALSLKKLTAALEDSEEERLAFFKIAAKFAGTKAGIEPEKESAEVLSRLKKLAQIHNELIAKKGKAAAQLQKALLKAADANDFALLMEEADKKLEKLLLCWALCGSLAEKGYASSFALGRKLNEHLKEEKLTKDDERTNLMKLFILAESPSVNEIKKDEKAAAYSVTKLLMSGKYCYILSGANCFDNIWWFNKEMSDDSLNKLILLSALISKSADTASVLKFYKTLTTAKTKAAYKCELMLKEFAPAAKKKSTKKPAAKKAPAKKAPAKKSTAKKAK